MPAAGIDSTNRSKDGTICRFGGGDQMSVVRFVYSRGRGGWSIHQQVIDITVPVSLTYETLREAEIRFLKAFSDEFGEDYLIQWEAWSLDQKQRYSTYRAFLPSS
jgi:hypothetical protein